MKPWFDDDEFWTTFSPSVFAERQWQAAKRLVAVARKGLGAA